jgi:hypothetical protein
MEIDGDSLGPVIQIRETINETIANIEKGRDWNYLISNGWSENFYSSSINCF